jgi:branched-subunit amino acid ABC-type transport system permease component
LLELLQLLVGGIAQGCVYGLIALGFVLIYKATEMVNFAQGDLTQDCLAPACPSMVLATPRDRRTGYRFALLTVPRRHACAAVATLRDY